MKTKKKVVRRKKDDPKTAIVRWKNDAVAYARERIKIELEWEQIEILESISLHNMIAIRSGHGIGKTTAIAIIAIWWLFNFSNSLVVCTAPTYRQIKDIVWVELKKWLNNSGLMEMVVFNEVSIGIKGYQKEWHILPRTSNKAENIAGFHNPRLLYIMDEASGVDPKMGETIEGALTEEHNKLIMIGNATQITGLFYDAFHSLRDIYKCLHYSSEKSNRVSKQYCDRMARKYGKDSDVYRVRVLGEFPKGEPDVLINLWLVEAAVNREVAPVGDIEIGVDPARFGNDDTVITYRRGLHVYPQIVIHGINTRKCCGQVAALVKGFRRMKIKHEIKVKVDETGIGAGVVDSLEELQEELYIKVIPVNNGAKAREEDEYYNLGAETWGETKNILPNCQCPDDEDLKLELCTRKYKIDPKGRIQLEKKEDYKKRIGKSPDKADSFVLCMTGYDIGVVIEDDFSINDTSYINQDSRGEGVI